jgi:hypothetical protein
MLIKRRGTKILTRFPNLQRFFPGRRVSSYKEVEESSGLSFIHTFYARNLRLLQALACNEKMQHFFSFSATAFVLIQS